jgi:hypothetical protein
VLYDKIKRNELRARLKPTDEGEWFLSLTDPTLPRGAVEIDTWNKPEQLTVALDRGLYICKKLDNKKQYTLWLCWLPEPPPMRPEIDCPTPCKRPSKREMRLKPIKQEEPDQLLKREIKREIKQEVKQEVKQEATLASPAPSTPPSTITLPKGPRVVSSEFFTPGPATKKSTTISLHRN